MRRYIERPLRWVQTRNNIQTRLVDGTFRFLCILEGDPDLVRKLRTLVALEICLGLGEVVLEQIEESSVVVLGDAFVAYKQGTILDQCIGSLDDQDRMQTGK